MQQDTLLRTVPGIGKLVIEVNSGYRGYGAVEAQRQDQGNGNS